MQPYRAPLTDIQLALAQARRFAGSAAIDEESNELSAAVLEEAGKLAEDVWAPLNIEGDLHGVKLDGAEVLSAPGFKAAYAQYAEAGWLGLCIEEEFGGQGLPFSLHMAVSELWNSANLSLALCPMLSMGAIEAMQAHASDELQQAYLGPLVEGRWTGTMNLTEPQAGSNLAAVKTKAVPEGDNFRIQGQKIFISWGEHDMAENIIHLVLARLPDAPDGVRGLSLFLVPKFVPGSDGKLGERNDAYAVSLEHKLGIHASPTCVMSFGESDGSRGALGFLVGEKNQGIACMFTMMNHARLEVGLEGVGVSERALQAASHFSLERKQGVVPGHEGQAPIVAHSDVRRMLLTMRALTEAGRALCYYAASVLDVAHHSDDASDANHRLGLLTPLVKAWCTENAQEVASLGLQVHGGMGFVEETGVAQFVRDARILPIYEGTNAIQAADLIGRKFLRNDGKAMSSLHADLEQELALVGQSDSKRLQNIGSDLSKTLNAHKNLCAWLLEKRDSIDAGACAFDFMLFTATLLGGVLLANQARADDSVMGSSEQRENKILSCQFYTRRILPRCLGYAVAIQSDFSEFAEKSDESFLS
ncbi:MAG: acyl-CoA dehydrogenase [Pseudomonadota bacterium]